MYFKDIDSNDRFKKIWSKARAMLDKYKEDEIPLPTINRDLYYKNENGGWYEYMDDCGKLFKSRVAKTDQELVIYLVKYAISSYCDRYPILHPCYFKDPSRLIPEAKEKCYRAIIPQEHVQRWNEACFNDVLYIQSDLLDVYLYICSLAKYNPLYYKCKNEINCINSFKSGDWLLRSGPTAVLNAKFEIIHAKMKHIADCIPEVKIQFERYEKYYRKMKEEEQKAHGKKL